MKADLKKLNLEMLERLYSQRARELEEAVLSGKPWGTVMNKRNALEEASLALHNKLESSRFSTPAEFPGRQNHQPRAGIP